METEKAKEESERGSEKDREWKSNKYTIFIHKGHDKQRVAERG